MQLVLTRYRDPYTEWGQRHRQRAEWVAARWQKMNRSSHLRGFHYWLVSQRDRSVREKPDGSLYQNTEKDWVWLLDSVLFARYMGIGVWDKLQDRKHPNPYDFIDYSVEPGQFKQGSNPNEVIRQKLNNLVDEIISHIVACRPSYESSQFSQYTLVVYCEKNTMNNVIEPVARKYDAIFQPLVGESSLERVLDIVERIAKRGKSARIFYISDFDPSGQQMPVSVARKFEFYARQMGLDIKLKPIALTYEQVIELKLPGIPTKETDTRRAGFIEQYGDRATELDALEALYPGRLAQIIEQALKPYYDSEAQEQVRNRNREIRQKAIQIAESYKPIIEQKLGGLDLELNIDFSSLANNWQAPKPRLIDDNNDNWLLDTKRPYGEQIWAYRKFKGGK